MSAAQLCRWLSCNFLILAAVALLPIELSAVLAADYPCAPLLRSCRRSFAALSTLPLLPSRAPSLLPLLAASCSLLALLSFSFVLSWEERCHLRSPIHRAQPTGQPPASLPRCPSCLFLGKASTEEPGPPPTVPLLPCCAVLMGSLAALLPLLPRSACGVRCRDFMNAALPWGDPDWNYISALLPVGPEGASNVLSVSFDSMTYPVTVDGIHTVSCCAALCAGHAAVHAVVVLCSAVKRSSPRRPPHPGNPVGCCWLPPCLLFGICLAALFPSHFRNVPAAPACPHACPPAMAPLRCPADLLNLRHGSEGAHL